MYTCEILCGVFFRYQRLISKRKQLAIVYGCLPSALVSTSVSCNGQRRLNFFGFIVLVNPRCLCHRATVLILCVCVCVHYHSSCGYSEVMNFTKLLCSGGMAWSRLHSLSRQKRPAILDPTRNDTICDLLAISDCYLQHLLTALAPVLDSFVLAGSVHSDQGWHQWFVQVASQKRVATPS